MAGWRTEDYAYDLDGEDPFDYCESFRIITEGMAAREGTAFKVPGLHGEQMYPHRLFEGHNIIIDTVLRYTDDAGAVTHVNGAAGHVYENLAAMKRLFGKTIAPLRLTRMDPNGLVGGDEYRIFLEQVQPIEANGDVDHQFIWTARASRPFWESTTLDGPDSLSTGNFNPGGNAPVDDAIITISGNGSVTNNTTDCKIETVGATGSVVIDNGARTVKVGSTPRDEWFVHWNDRWMTFEGGINNALVVSGTVSIRWREKRH